MPRGRLHLFDGHRLRALRLERGLTLTEVAALVDALPTSVSRWETGEQKPDPRAARRLADVFDVPVIDLTVLDDLDDPRVGLPELRHLRGLTSAEAAAELGITRKQLSAHENGHHDPHPDELEAMSRLYDVTTTQVNAARNRSRRQHAEALDDARRRARGASG